MGIEGLDSLKPGNDVPPSKENRYKDAHDPVALLHQLAGTASVCWEDMSGTGVFREDEARAACTDAFERLAELIPMHHDDQTLIKVYTALNRSGLTSGQAQDAIMEMQNQGIYFREVK